MRNKLVGLFLMVVGLCVYSQEKLTLTAPIVQPATTNLMVVFLQLDWPGANIVVKLRALDATNGFLPQEPLTFYYNDTNAISLMKNLNTNNFSVVSLQRKIIQKLQNDGFLGAGSVTGTPQ